MTAILWVAVIALSLTWSGVAAAGTSAPRDLGLGIALVGGPSDRADDPALGREIFDTAPPGIRRTWQLRVANDTPDPADLLVFVADVTRTSQGRTISTRPTEGPLSEWITFSDDAFTLEARGTRIIDVTIQPPPDAPETEFEAAIVVSPVIRPATTGIQTVGRVAMPLFLTTDATFVGADFQIETIGAGRTEDGRPLVDVEVRNTGGRTVSMIGRLDLTDGPGGLEVRDQTSINAVTVDPGDRGVIRFLLDEALPAGPWLAFAVVSGGNLERAADATVTFPSRPGTNAPALPATPRSVEEQRRVLLPIASSLLLLVLVVLATIAWGAWRRRREDEDEAPMVDDPDPLENDVNAVE